MYDSLKLSIQEAIRRNGQGLITGDLLQSKLLEIINALGYSYQYKGIITPLEVVDTPDYNVVYVAKERGLYLQTFTLQSGEMAYFFWNAEEERWIDFIIPLGMTDAEASAKFVDLLSDQDILGFKTFRNGARVPFEQLWDGYTGKNLRELLGGEGREEIFFANYDRTTIDEIRDAVSAGKLVACKFVGFTYMLTSLMDSAVFIAIGNGEIRQLTLSRTSVWSHKEISYQEKLTDTDGGYGQRIKTLETNSATKDELEDVEGIANNAMEVAGNALANSNTAIAIAEGKATGYVFATKEAMDEALEEHEFTDKLHMGDNLYILALDVPDYWWDGSQARELETQKVDLSAYLTAEQIATLYATKTEVSKKVERVELEYHNGETPFITYLGKSEHLSFEQIVALVSDEAKFVTLLWETTSFLLPQYFDGAAIIFTGVSVMGGSSTAIRVAMSEDGDFHSYTMDLASVNQTNLLAELIAKKQDKTFYATYGTTTFAEIVSAYEQGKEVKCRENNKEYSLVVLEAEHAYFVCNNSYYSRQITCSSSNRWGISSINLEQTSKRQSVITESDDNYPSSKAVVDYVNSMIVATINTEI